MRGIALALPLLLSCAAAPRSYVEAIPSTTVRFEMVWIPAPRPFFLGKTEVTWEEYEAFWPGVIGKNLAIRHHDWTREPTPRADVRRLDNGKGGLYRRNRNSR